MPHLAVLCSASPARLSGMAPKKKKPCNNPPTAVLSLVAATTINTDVTVGVRGADTDGVIVGGQVWFGDGATQIFDGPTFSGTHQYALPGKYTVTAIVKDNAQSSGTSASLLSVLDPAVAPPPTITCPGAITVTAPGTASVAVVYPTPVITGGVAPITVTYSMASGALFPVGSTTVTVRATDARGRTATCFFGVIVIPTVVIDPDPVLPPSAPTELELVAVTATRVDLFWNDTSTTETGFKIERCTGAGCTGFIQIGLANASSTAFSDFTATPNTLHRYRVSAINSAGASAPTDIAEVTTPPILLPDTVAPSVPTGLATGVIAQTTAGISWTASTDAVGVVGYRVYVGGVRVQDITAPVTTTLLTGLLCATAYSVTVDAVDAAGNRSAQSSPLAFTTAACDVIVVPPTLTSVTVAPSTLQAGLPATVTVTLSGPALAGGSVVTLSVSHPLVVTLPTSVTVLAGQLTASVGLTTPSAAPTTTVQITASLAAVTRTTTLSVTQVVVVDTTPPTVPQGLTASSVAPTTLSLNWLPSSDANGVASYGVYRGSTRILTVTSPTAAITGLTCGTSYPFSVDAVDPAGNRSAQSAVLNVTTAVCPEVPPTLTGISLSPSSVTAGGSSTLTVTLSGPALSGGAGLTLNSSQPSVASVATLVDVPAGQVTTTTPVTTVASAPTTTVVFSAIRAGVIKQATLAVTAQVVAPTAPSAPTNLVASRAGSQAAIAWTDTAQNESGFTIERCTGAGCTSFVQIGATAANVVTLQDATVAADQTYRYRVQAWNAVGPSPYSNIAQINPVGAQAVLTRADLQFKGYYRFDTTFTLWYAYCQMDFRTVGSERRLFTIGGYPDQWPLYEYAMPAGEPSLDIATAPIITFRKDWGPCMAQFNTGGAFDQNIPGGLLWDDTYHGVWIMYGDIYAPVAYCPGVVFAHLDDATGRTTFYGPWRIDQDAERTKGSVTKIPQAWANAYTSGRTAGLSASAHSISSPNGATILAATFPNPFTTPRDVIAFPRDRFLEEHVTIPTTTVVLHDYPNRQTRDTRWKQCNWGLRSDTEGYYCNRGTGAYILPGAPRFNGDLIGQTTDDTMLSQVWVDLPDKKGVLFFGCLSSTPLGYTAPGDPDGFTHTWYGPAFNENGDTARSPLNCCHAQDDPWWAATGPGAHYRMAKGWIYNPDSFIPVAQGLAAPWSTTPTEEFWFGDAGQSYTVPRATNRVPPGFFRNSQIIERRIYVGMNEIDHFPFPDGKPRHAIGVFDIA